VTRPPSHGLEPRRTTFQGYHQPKKFAQRTRLRRVIVEQARYLSVGGPQVVPAALRVVLVEHRRAQMRPKAAMLRSKVAATVREDWAPSKKSTP